jgi:hypothetical protein
MAHEGLLAYRILEDVGGKPIGHERMLYDLLLEAYLRINRKPSCLRLSGRRIAMTKAL